MHACRSTLEDPTVTLNAADYRRLSALADAAFGSAPDVAALLADELDRASVVSGATPAGTVGMGSTVEFRDDVTGRIQSGTLVYPGEADISQRRISVLTPVGTALVGLSVGQSIAWTTRSGERRRLTVLNVAMAA